MRHPFGRIGVFLGGRSRERAISLKSGRAVCQALRQAGLDVIAIDTANGFRSQLRQEPIDLAFLALHGKGGEDGSIQRFLERSRIHYVGSSPTASALAFDKARAKEAFRRSGIPTPPYDVLTRRDWIKKLEHWRPPYVVKPVCEGSSIGIFFVESGKDEQEGRKKIVERCGRYPQLIVEQKIEGREFTVGILGDRALPVIELRPKRSFYDYQAKYTKGLTDYLIPAPISVRFGNRLQSLAIKAHRLLSLRDLSRTDFKVDGRGNPFVLEVNSIPGFTETSLLPKAAKEAGLDFTKLCLNLVELAHRRRIHEEEQGE